jgi:hypothetical protein
LKDRQVRITDVANSEPSGLPQRRNPLRLELHGILVVFDENSGRLFDFHGSFNAGVRAENVSRSFRKRLRRIARSSHGHSRAFERYDGAEAVAGSRHRLAQFSHGDFRSVTIQRIQKGCSTVYGSTIRSWNTDCNAGAVKTDRPAEAILLSRVWIPKCGYERWLFSLV